MSEKKKINPDYLETILISSLVTATGYTAWHIYMTKAKKSWSGPKTNIGLFLVVFVALLVANIIFTLIFRPTDLVEENKKKNDFLTIGK